MHTQAQANTGDMTLLKRAIAQRAGQDLVVGSPAWDRQIMLLDEDLINSVMQADPTLIEGYGGRAFMEQFATEFFVVIGEAA